MSHRVYIPVMVLDNFELLYGSTDLSQIEL